VTASPELAAWIPELWREAAPTLAVAAPTAFVLGWCSARVARGGDWYEHGARTATIVLVALAWSWIASLAALVLEARLRCGIWPHPQRGSPFDGTWDPSPLDPKACLLYGVSYYSLFATFLAPLVLLPLAGGELLGGKRRSLAWLSIGLLGGAAGWAQIRFDPGAFFEWFLD
jgi:hypothetical protein